MYIGTKWNEFQNLKTLKNSGLEKLDENQPQNSY